MSNATFRAKHEKYIAWRLDAEHIADPFNARAQASLWRTGGLRAVVHLSSRKAIRRMVNEIKRSK
jgi:hypothetical protein